MNSLTAPQAAFTIYPEDLHLDDIIEIATIVTDQEQTIALAPADLGIADLHRQWACTSCRYGRPSTALKHAFLGLCICPTEHRSWSVLRYVCSRTLSRARARVHSAGATPASLS